MARTEPQAGAPGTAGTAGTARWALVTVTYDSADALRRYWTGVDLPADVDWVVVDNASADDSAAVARDLGARVIELGVNRGFGAANNVGFAATDAPYVCFVNPDVRPEPGDLAILEAALDAAPRRLVAPQLRNDDGTAQPNGRGRAYLTDKVLHRVRPEAVRERYWLLAEPGQTRAVSWLTGAVLAGRREWLAALGPWDEAFFVYFEDCDLAERNRRAGGESLVLGDVRWTHGWKRESAGVGTRAWRRELASSARFYARYPSLIAPLGRRAAEALTTPATGAGAAATGAGAPAGGRPGPRRISVVLPAYNRAATIERALRSVLDQTVPVDEVIVVDDASTDATAAIVAAVAAQDPRVVLLRRPRNAGANAARNAGLDRATGTLIAFQDSDDVWAPDFVERLAPQVPPGGLAFGQARVTVDGQVRGLVPPGPVGDVRRALRYRNVISTQTVLADAALLREVRFDPALRRFQDWDLWLTASRRPGVEFREVDGVVADVIQGADSITQGSARVRSRALARVLRKHAGLLVRSPLALVRLLARIVLPRRGELARLARGMGRGRG